MSEHSKTVLELQQLLEPASQGNAASETLLAAARLIDQLLALPPGSLTKKESALLMSALAKTIVYAKPELRVQDLVKALLQAK